MIRPGKTGLGNIFFFVIQNIIQTQCSGVTCIQNILTSVKFETLEDKSIYS